MAIMLWYTSIFMDIQSSGMYLCMVLITCFMIKISIDVGLFLKFLLKTQICLDFSNVYSRFLNGKNPPQDQCFFMSTKFPIAILSKPLLETF